MKDCVSQSLSQSSCRNTGLALLALFGHPRAWWSMQQISALPDRWWIICCSTAGSLVTVNMVNSVVLNCWIKHTLHFSRFAVFEHCRVSRNWDCQWVMVKAGHVELHEGLCGPIQLQEHWAGIVWPPQNVEHAANFCPV